jgi:hypothetical protein
MSVWVLVVDDESDVEMLFRQQFRRDLRQGRFVSPCFRMMCQISCTSTKAGKFGLDSPREGILLVDYLFP